MSIRTMLFFDPDHVKRSAQEPNTPENLDEFGALIDQMFVFNIGIQQD